MVDSFGSPTTRRDLDIFDRIFGLRPPRRHRALDRALPSPGYGLDMATATTISRLPAGAAAELEDAW
jgi:hypothetical protein